MKVKWALALVLGLCLFAPNYLLAQSKAAVDFERLKALAGDWQALGPNGLEVAINYQLVSGGNAVMETRVPVGEPSMVTVFHLDGEQLMMTHYCSIGNQPRMRAEPSTLGSETLRFSFLDATNLSSPPEGHMRALSFTWRDDGQFQQVWTWRQDGQDQPNVFQLSRKKD